MATVPSIVLGPPGATVTAMSRYLSEDLPPVLLARLGAWSIVQECVHFPRVTHAADLRSRAMPAFDKALQQAEAITGASDVLQLNVHLVELLRLERDYLFAAAEADDHPDDEHTKRPREAQAAAEAALAMWSQLVPGRRQGQQRGIGSQRGGDRACPPGQGQ